MCAKSVNGSQQGELITFATREEASTNFETHIVPRCGHSLTTVEFDAVMRMNDFYEFDSNGIMFDHYKQILISHGVHLDAVLVEHHC